MYCLRQDASLFVDLPPAQSIRFLGRGTSTEFPCIDEERHEKQKKDAEKTILCCLLGDPTQGERVEDDRKTDRDNGEIVEDVALERPATRYGRIRRRRQSKENNDPLNCWCLV